MQEKYDLAVIGSGPGGYVAAIRASQLGMKVAIIEANHLGGICLNWGCIPTKALLRSAEVLHLIKNAKAFGLSVKDVSFELQFIVERSRAVAKQLASGVQHLMKKNKIEVIEGFGSLLGQMAIEIKKKDGSVRKISAKNIILATGARPRNLPGLEADGTIVWNYKHAMMPDHLPKRLLVVGSGAIGIEFASFYAELGSEVTVIEVQDRILPAEDKEISNIARKSFEDRGIKIYTNTTLKTLEKKEQSAIAQIEMDQKETLKMEFDRIIMAVGIVANTENIGLNKTKIKLEKGFIVTDKYCHTDEPNIYAIGDAASAPWLAHKASHEGIIAVEKMAGLKVKPMNPQNIPGCTYSEPQIASVGLTEEKAKALGYDVKIGKFPFLANGKAIALGNTEGLIKTIFDKKTGELLGAHLIGAEVTELIQGFAIAKTAELTEEDLIHTIFPHPTLSEMMHESSLAAESRALHY